MVVATTTTMMAMASKGMVVMPIIKIKDTTISTIMAKMMATMIEGKLLDNSHPFFILPPVLAFLAKYYTMNNTCVDLSKRLL